jgi:hypothetical protein
MRTPLDEVLTWQCPGLGRSIHGESVCGRLADSTASDRNRTHTRIYPGSAPGRVKTYILLVWSSIAGIFGAITMVHRCNLAEVEEDGVASLCMWDLCEIRCLWEIRDLCKIWLSRGCPWWLYICSQLGFTSSLCLLLRVEVLGLAGFMYPSSGLLSWQEPGRLIWVPEGSFPRHHCFGWCFLLSWVIV